MSLIKGYEHPIHPTQIHTCSNAEALAGRAFNSAGLGLVHAMSHQLGGLSIAHTLEADRTKVLINHCNSGGLYSLAHGLCNGVLLAAVQAFIHLQKSRYYVQLVST